MTLHPRDTESEPSRKRLRRKAAVADAHTREGDSETRGAHAEDLPIREVLNVCQDKSTLNEGTASPLPGPSANSRPGLSGSGPGGGGLPGSPPPGSASTPDGILALRYVCRRCVVLEADRYRAMDLEEHDGLRFLRLDDPNHCECCGQVTTVLGFRERRVA